MKLKYKCALCDAEYALLGFTNHIQRTHKIKYKEYYDTYIEPNTEHICRFCGKPCDFSNSHGYYETCNSASCVRKLQHETMYERYGKTCRHADKIKSKPVIEYKFHCTLCGKGFKNHSMLNRHLNKEHGAEITTEEYYLKYLNGKVEYCEICGKPAKWLGTHYHNVCGSAECTHELRSRNNAMNIQEYRDKISESLINLSKERKEEIKEKTKQTNIERYGVEHIWKDPEFRKMGLETMQKKYGTTCGFFTPKAKQTVKEKYGAEHFSNTTEFSKRRVKKYNQNGMSFDSKDEIMLYNFATDMNIPITLHPECNFKYLYNNKVHTYEPDFIINEKYYETKGLQFFEDKNPNNKMINPYDRSMDGLFEAKHQCMLSNNVRILTDTGLFSLIKEFYNIEIDENIIFNKCFGKEFPGTAKWPAKHPIWEAFLPGKLSPKMAWNNEKLFKRAIKNMIEIIKTSILEGKYRPFVNRHVNAIINIDKNNDILPLILNRFTIAKIAPKVTALDENDLLKIINEAGLDMSSGVYCPMAGFGGIVRAAKKYAEMHGLEPNIEAYDINENFCKWYGWTQRDVLAQVVHTDKVVVVCPPFGKKYEHWKGTPDEMSDIEFTDWVKLIKKHIIAPNYIFIGPETGEGKNKCGLFKKKLGISLYKENDA